MNIPLIIAVFIILVITVIIFSLYRRGAKNIISVQKKVDEERDQIRNIISNKANSSKIKEKDRYGRNLLHQSIHYNFDDIAIDLINKNIVDVNEINDKGETALKLASKLGHFKVVKALIDRNADVNIADKNNISPLWAASGNDFKDIVRILLQYGADINHRDSIWGMTPVMRAAQSGRHELVKLLLKFNPDLSVRALNGETVIDIARSAIDKNWEIFQEDNEELREMLMDMEQKTKDKSYVYSNQKKTQT